VILRSNGSLGRGKPSNALRAKGVEEEEEEEEEKEEEEVVVAAVTNLWSCTSILHVFIAWCLIEHKICFHGLVLDSWLSTVKTLPFDKLFEF
jgi:hypothetical protein